MAYTLADLEIRMAEQRDAVLMVALEMRERRNAEADVTDQRPRQSWWRYYEQAAAPGRGFPGRK